MSEWRELPTGDIVAFAEAVKAGDEIHLHIGDNLWRPWPGAGWDSGWIVCARAKPKVRKIKILGWIDPDNGNTFTRSEDFPVEKTWGWIRDPSQDREVEDLELTKTS